MARLAGAAVAACLTAAAWHACSDRRSLQLHRELPDATMAEHLGGSIGALSLTAATAAIFALWPSPISVFANAWGSALAGALLSPCSTADAVIARVLVHDRGAQAAFVVAAQCIDVRLLALFARRFGPARTVLAAFAGCAGCAAAWLVAR
jgi:hypothetical protein